MTDMRERYESGLSLPQYLETVRENEKLWRGVHDRVRLPEGAVDEARALPGTWHLLALSEDWCGDAVNILPVVSRLAEAVPNVDLRVLSRDENLDIMDAHLTNGRSRSIPIILVLDDDYRERAWWGPRPREIQRWVIEEGMKKDPGPRYAHVRRFYARDKGRAIVSELLGLMRSAAAAPASP